MKTNKIHKTNKELESLKGAGLLNNPDLKELIKFAQVMPDSMMQEIKRISKAKGISVELEVVSRLLATFVKPEVLGIESLSGKTLIQNFNAQEAFTECKENHERWIYPYEVEKLRTFLSFKGKIPHHIKEKFTVIDVKAETKRILEEGRSKGNENEK